MSYAIKEIFYTLQGEGANAGRAAVFCRFAGCNLWSGREEDRATAACRFCDTDFVGMNGTLGGRFATGEDLASLIDQQWPAASPSNKLVVLTGGEPLLQVDAELIAALHVHGFEIAVETNGTIAAPAGIDWICVSPKARGPLVQLTGSEIKVVVPQEGIDLEQLSALKFDNYFVQAMDNERTQDNMKWAIDWCMKHPQWRLSVQSHKTIGIR